MDLVLGVADPGDDDRIYGPGQDLPDEEPGTKRDEQWGRLVVLPANPLWGLPGTGTTIREQPKRERNLAFLVRSEFNKPEPDYDPGLACDAAQAEVFARLEGWAPTGMTYAEAWLSLFRSRPPQSAPLYDDKRRLWYTSSQWQAVIAPPA